MSGLYVNEKLKHGLHCNQGENNCNILNLILLAGGSLLPCLVSGYCLKGKKCDSDKGSCNPKTKTNITSFKAVTPITTALNGLSTLGTFGTPFPYLAPIFNQCYDTRDVLVSREGANVLFFREGGQYYILPKLDSIEWSTVTPINTLSISGIVIILWININNVYGPPYTYATSTIGLGPGSNFTGVAYNPPFIFAPDASVPNTNVPLLLAPGSQVSFTLEVQATITGAFIAPIIFTLNDFKLELVKVF